MYNRIETELQGMQKALQSNHTVPTMPRLEGTKEEGDEQVQIRKIANTVKVHLREAQQETM